jgi:hypothetical protein
MLRNVTTVPRTSTDDFVYGCETWSVILWEEHRLTVCNRAWRKIHIFGPKRAEVKGVWKKLHNELYCLCPSRNFIWVIKSKRMRWVGHVARVGEERNTQGLIGKFGGKRQLQNFRYK